MQKIKKTEQQQGNWTKMKDHHHVPKQLRTNIWMLAKWEYEEKDLTLNFFF